MKNVFLFIVLGLFTVGCFEDNPLGLIDPDGYGEIQGMWKCPHQEWFFETEEDCILGGCQEECYECPANYEQC